MDTDNTNEEYVKCQKALLPLIYRGRNFKNMPYPNDSTDISKECSVNNYKRIFNEYEIFNNYHTLMTSVKENERYLKCQRVLLPLIRTGQIFQDPRYFGDNVDFPNSCSKSDFTNCLKQLDALTCEVPRKVYDSDGGHIIFSTKIKSYNTDKLAKMKEERQIYNNM